MKLLSQALTYIYLAKSALRLQLMNAEYQNKSNKLKTNRLVASLKSVSFENQSLE